MMLIAISSAYSKADIKHCASTQAQPALFFILHNYFIAKRILMKVYNKRYMK